MAFITGAKSAIFDRPDQVAAFIAASVTTILAILCDNSGKYVLFYT